MKTVEPIIVSSLSEASEADVVDGALAVISAPDASAATGYTTKKSLLSRIKDYIIGKTSISGVGDGTVTGAISALNSDLAYSSETLTTGVVLYRYGKVRVLTLGVTVSAQTFAHLAAEDRPAANFAYSIRYTTTANVRYPGLVTINSSGAINASYYNNATTTVSSITSGTVAGSAVWIVP